MQEGRGPGGGGGFRRETSGYRPRSPQQFGHRLGPEGRRRGPSVYGSSRRGLGRALVALGSLSLCVLLEMACWASGSRARVVCTVSLRSVS